jgi:hypothetical protein
MVWEPSAGRIDKYVYVAQIDRNLFIGGLFHVLPGNRPECALSEDTKI